MTQIFDRSAASIGLLVVLLIAACGGSDGGTEVGRTHAGLTPGDIVADDFHTGVLDTQVWQVVDPQGDGTVDLVGAGTPDAHLQLSVPTGVEHDAWTDNTTLRAMQPALDEDFEIEVKFESEPTQQYQSQGVLVEQDGSNYIRFDVFYAGGSLRAFSATFSNGAPTVRVHSLISSGPTIYLRLARSGDQWTARYSYDGVSWATATSFSHALTVSSVGVFAGNFWPNPPYTAVVDYFYETSVPISPEDPPLCNPADPLILTTQGTNGTILRNPDQSSYSCGDVVTLTAQPDPGATFVGWGGALSGTTNPVDITINEDTTVTATFDLDTTPPQVSNINVTAGETSATVSWQTDELSIGDVEYGLTTSYELGFVASSTLSTAHSVTLPGLSGGQVYHYRITAEDSFGNSLTGADATFTTAVGVCVLTTQATNGTILRSPNAGSYACGTVVTLTAQPNPGGTFLGWGGALSGTANPEVLTIDADTTVTASFALDATPPQVSNINVTAGETSATVSWQTDELSIGDVEYGLTTSYELGSVVSSTSSTSHAVSLLGLNEGQTYHYRVTAEDSFGNGTTSADATFTTNTSGGGTGGAGGSGGGSAPGAFLSDDFFDAALDPVLWEVVDPQGDGTVDLIGAGTPDAHLLLSVPAGTVHDAWTNNTALRVMQPASDEDFEIEVKFESEPTQKYQSQGVLAEQDPSNYVRFDVYTDGSSLRAFVATFTNGSPSVKANQAIAAAPTTYLRLSRSGDQWTAQYSDDGLSWTTATSFAHSLTVTSVGPFAGNFSPNPPFTAVVDYFFETGSPIDPEDGLACTAGDQFTVAANSNGPGAVALDPDLSSYGCGEVVTLTAQPDPGATFVGWSGAINGTSNPATLTVSADANVNADFAVDSSPPQISNVTTTPTVSSATISWQTDEVSTGLVEYGLTTSYELGTVPSSTTSTTHSVTLNGLSSEQIYHFRITAEDGVANSATTGDYTFTTASSSGGPTVDVWYGNSQTFGALGEPQQWVNVLGQVYDPDGLSLLTYSLNGGAPQSLSQGPFRRLAEPGDFNVELDFQELSSGNNVIAIRAVDALGNETIETVNVSYTPGSVWPLPYQVDWSAVAQISDVAQIVDGRWSIVDGELTSDLQRYDRIVAIGDLSWTDYEVTVPFTVRQIDPEGFVSTNGAPGIGAMLKWPGHTDWTGDQQPNWGYYPAGGAAWVEFSPDGTGQVLITDFQPGGLFRYDLQSVILLDTTYIWKVRVTSQSDGSALYQIKTWPAGDPEPVSWQVTQADGNDVGGGSLALIAHFADVRFGNVTIEPL